MNRYLLAVIFAALLSLFSCSNSTPANFYSLSAIPKPTILPTKKSMAIKLGPITLPDSLNQSRLVTKKNSHVLNISEFERWAGDFQDNIQNVIAENLSVLIPTDQIIYSQELEFSNLDYQVTVNIREMTGELGGKINLVANWTIIPQKIKRKVIFNKLSLSQKMQGNSYEQYVEVLSDLLAELSRTIAIRLNSFEQGTDLKP